MIQVLKNTTKNPLQYIGEIAGICWNSDITDAEKNIKRAKSCIKSGHTRVMEYVDVHLVLSEYSARCIREAYTHIAGVSRLQESTRYVDCSNTGFFVPKGMTEEQENLYKKSLDSAFADYQELLNSGISKEDAANNLPLGMNSKFVWKINLTALIHFMNLRTCSRAYKEIRAMCHEIIDALKVLDDDWAWICENLFVPKCEVIGYCQEEKCCGRKPKGMEGLKQQIIEEYEKSKQN